MEKLTHHNTIGYKSGYDICHNGLDTPRLPFPIYAVCDLKGVLSYISTVRNKEWKVYCVHVCPCVFQDYNRWLVIKTDGGVCPGCVQGVSKKC